MKISHISPNIAFKKVTTQAAQRAFDEIADLGEDRSALKKDDVKQLVAIGYVARSYDVDFSKEANRYLVCRNGDYPTSLNLLPYGKPVRFDNFEDAVDYSLEIQEEHNNTLIKNARNYSEGAIKTLFTTESYYK